MAEATFDVNAPAAGASMVQSGMSMSDTLIGNAQARQLAQRQQNFGEMVQLRQLANTDREFAQRDAALSLDQQRMNLERQKFTTARNDIKRVLSAFGGGIVVGDAEAARMAATLRTLDYNKQQTIKAQEQASVLRQELLRAAGLPEASERLSSLRTAVAANPLGFELLNNNEQQQFLDIGKQSQAVASQDAYGDLLSVDSVEDYKKAVSKHKTAIAANPTLANLYQSRYVVLSTNARVEDTNDTRLAAAKIAAARTATSKVSDATLEKYYLDKSGMADSGAAIWYYRLPGVANPIIAFDGTKFYDFDGKECSRVELMDNLRLQAAEDRNFQDTQEAPVISAPTPNLDVYGGSKLQMAASIDNAYAKMLVTPAQ